MVCWFPETLIRGESRKWFLSKRICRTEFVVVRTIGCWHMWTYAPSLLQLVTIIYSSGQCWAKMRTFTTQHRPVKVRRWSQLFCLFQLSPLCAALGNTHSETRKINILSEVKLFLYSQIKQFVIKAVSLNTTVVMPNRIKYTVIDLPITVFGLQKIG